MMCILYVHIYIYTYIIYIYTEREREGEREIYIPVKVILHVNLFPVNVAFSPPSQNLARRLPGSASFCGA